MSSSTTNLETRISVLDYFLSPSHTFSCLRQNFRSISMSHIVHNVIVTLKIQAITTSKISNVKVNYLYDNPTFWRVHILIIQYSTSMIDPLKRDWISIYASKRCQCKIYINFYEDHKLFLPSCVVTDRWGFSFYIYMYNKVEICFYLNNSWCAFENNIF
jgi:hypothetical protein